MLERLSVAICFLSLSAASVSVAEVYVGAGYGGEIESGTFRKDLERFTETTGDSWKLFAGYRFGRHLAVELGWHDLGEQICCTGVADLGFSSSVDGVSAAIIGRWPLRRIALFAKAGALDWSEDGTLISLIGPSPGSASGTDLLLGAGFELDLPAGFGIRGEWEGYEFGSVSTDSAWISVLYRF